MAVVYCLVALLFIATDHSRLPVVIIINVRYFCFICVNICKLECG